MKRAGVVRRIDDLGRYQYLECKSMNTYKKG